MQIDAKTFVLGLGAGIIVALVVLRLVGIHAPERIRKPLFYTGLAISVVSFGISFLH